MMMRGYLPSLSGRRRLDSVQIGRGCWRSTVPREEDWCTNPCTLGPGVDL
jgi:hypothetical protein